MNKGAFVQEIAIRFSLLSWRSAELSAASKELRADSRELREHSRTLVRREEEAKRLGTPGGKALCQVTRRPPT